MGVIAAQVLKCPDCGAPIDEARDYEEDIVTIPSIGGVHRLHRGYEVTLVHKGCGWERRTNNWRQFLPRPPVAKP